MTDYQGNKYILGRLEGIQEMLLASHKANKAASSNTKGKERESFINLFLSNALPPQFRFGSGEITDLSGKISGQIDIVIEYPLLPSIQIPLTNSDTRLYLAEGVAAAIEVKSDLRNQWEEVKETSRKLKHLRRRFSASKGYAPTNIPLFAVGYTGWKYEKTAIQKLEEGFVDGILIIEDGLFIYNNKLLLVPQHNGIYTKGWSLWGLIIQLCSLATSLQSTSLDLLLYTRTDLMIIKKICNRVNDDKLIEVKFFDFIDEEGIDIQEAKIIFESLIKECFIEIVGEESEIEEVKIRVTNEAIQFTEFMPTPFELG